MRRPASDPMERRLAELREEARTKGIVLDRGVRAERGPLPEPPAPEPRPESPGYYGMPVLKPPVWEWMIGAYFFVGGLAGMAALLAAAALLSGDRGMARVALWAAGAGAVLSPVLLAWDLGRPARFLNMLRVLKVRSPMSVGSWLVTAFGAAVVPALVFFEWHGNNLQAGAEIPAVHVLSVVFVLAGAGIGIFLATYTGALLAVTAVPAWNLHRWVLPLHFGAAGLGSAAAVVELAGFRSPALHATGYAAALAQTLIAVWLEVRRHGAADRALHEGRPGAVLRIGSILEGPLAGVLRLAGFVPGAAVSFLLGALASRFGWLEAGRDCAGDPEAVFASQTDADHGK